ncbi:hypothetical protein [Streptomyces sp. NPDC050263]
MRLDLFGDYGANVERVRLLRTGRFALETHADEIAAVIRAFLAPVEFGTS